MAEAIWLGLFLPLVGFLVLMTNWRRLGRIPVGLIACGTLLVSFLCFSHVLYHYTQQGMSPFTVTLFQWIPVVGISADFAAHIDPLSLLMTMIITGVGFIIHVYSNGYMEHDEDYARFFAFMNLFVFAMLLLVLASSLILLFVGWEGVGLASYLLIGYYYERSSAAAAATKAFVVNRVGDLGLLLGILLTFYLFGTSDIVTVSEKAKQQFAAGAPIITLLTLLYFVGAVGKSAQLPLHTWLPDAMEGPTPVSALIHAATMVTAGVYLVVRMHEVFLLAPETMLIIGTIGAVTSLFASLCAVGQTDLKRVLAYSTMSQLGLMFLACGVGAFYAAMFHLTMHAFIKALLFLSAGNIVHMMEGTTEMAEMGGLARFFKKSNVLFLIGIVALSGIPPLAAFFSKDLILEQTSAAGFTTLYLVGFVACVLTAFYLTRAYVIAFTGPTRVKKKVEEAPPIMIWPLTLLGALSIGGGLLGYFLQGFLAKVGVTLAMNEHVNLLLDPEAWMSVAGAILGIVVAVYLYTKIIGREAPPVRVLYKSFYADEIYQGMVVLPLRKLSQVIVEFFEPYLFDGVVTKTASGTRSVSFWLQRMQSGQIRSYIAWMVLGSAALIVYLTK